MLEISNEELAEKMARNGKGRIFFWDGARKPLRETLTASYCEIDGINYEIARIKTDPYHDIAEARLYRKAKEKTGRLRTVADWERFFDIVDDLKTKETAL